MSNIRRVVFTSCAALFLGAAAVDLDHSDFTALVEGDNFRQNIISQTCDLNCKIDIAEGVNLALEGITRREDEEEDSPSNVATVEMNNTTIPGRSYPLSLTNNFKRPAFVRVIEQDTARQSIAGIAIEFQDVRSLG